MKKSELFCSFYFPDAYAKTGDPYQKFGFDWPKKDDLVKLCMDKKIEPKDLILEKVYWKNDGYGFSMLQLEFKGGIKSPVFKTVTADQENYRTAFVKQEKASHINLWVSENKFCERIDFSTKRANADDYGAKHDIVASMKPGRCENTEIKTYEIPDGHSIVGVFGLVGTNKYVTADMERRDWNDIRGIGFITMQI